MKVRVRSGFTKDLCTYKPGDIVEFADDYASELLRAGFAEIWEPETAAVTHTPAIAQTANARGAGRKRTKR